LNIQSEEEMKNMRMAISAFVLSAFLAPAIAGAQPGDAGVPVPDGGVMSGMDAGAVPRSTHKDPKAKKAKDDTGSEGSPGSGSSPGGSSGSNKSAHGSVDAGTGHS
jgi:hypothetical protein